MKLWSFVAAAVLAAGILAGCGGEDRGAAARETVQAYWNSIEHGKFKQAYSLLTSGDQAAVSESDFSQNYLGFLENSGSLKIIVGTPMLNGDQATVPVTLASPRTTQKLHAYQHLFWESGSWRISDQNGGLSRQP